MDRIDELRQKRAKLVKDQRALLDAAEEAHKRDGASGEPRLGPEQQEEYESRERDIDSLESRISREERQRERERELDTAEAERQEAREREERDNPDRDPAAGEVESEEYREAWWEAVAFGRQQLRPEHREMVERHIPREQDKGTREMRALTTGDLGTGGAVVPPATLGRLYAALKDFGSVERAGAEILSTANGATIQYPTYDETSVYGERLGENKEASSQDVGFGEVEIGAHIYSSKKISVPISLVQDSAIGIEEFILRILGERIGRKQNQDWTVATGAGNAPEGIVTGIPSGSVTTGATGQASVIKKADELIDLQHSVDPAYRADRSIGWMMHHQMLRDIRKLKDNEGRYLFQPGLTAREPDTLLGDRITLNNEMSTPGASNTTILYGAFRYYLIRRVNEMMLFTLRETGATKMQIEFVGFHRADAKLINAGTSPMVAWKHPAS